jgi:hypothetical protein
METMRLLVPLLITTDVLAMSQARQQTKHVQQTEGVFNWLRWHTNTPPPDLLLTVWLTRLDAAGVDEDTLRTMLESSRLGVERWLEQWPSPRKLRYHYEQRRMPRFSEEEYQALLARGNVRELCASRPAPDLLPPRPPLYVDPEGPGGDLEDRIQTLALAHGWLFYHTYKSRKSTPGWPDDALCHPDGGPLYLWETKGRDEAVSAAQRRWLDALGKVTYVDARVVRPADWGEVQRLLMRRT